MGLVLEFCNKLIVNIFEIYAILQFIDIFLGNQSCNKPIMKIMVCLKFISTLLVDNYVPYVLVNFIVSFGTIFLLVCCYRTELLKKFTISIGVNLLFALSEAFAAIIVGNEFFGSFSKAANEKNIELFLSRIVFWTIIVCIKWLKQDKGTFRLSKKIWAFGAVVIINTLGQLVIICSQDDKNNLLELMSLLGAGITIFLIIYLYDCLVKIFMEHTQAELVRKELEYYHQEAGMIQQSYETVQHFRHDWNNRIQVINQLVNGEQWDELKKYIKEVKGKVANLQLYSNTGNLVVDSIINRKLDKARKKKIDVTANILIPKDIGVDKDDMVVIMGNLLDNAIEANEYKSDNKCIGLNLCYEDGCVLIHIYNTFSQMPVMDNGKYLTHKKNSYLHGIGIKSVEDTIERYQGAMDISTDRGVFTVDIMLYT